MGLTSSGKRQLRQPEVARIAADLAKKIDRFAQPEGKWLLVDFQAGRLRPFFPNRMPVTYLGQDSFR
jgi:hypothetical protein